MKLTVCIAAFNEEKYIESLVNTLLSQDEDGLYQILIVNDGSTDNTYNICNELAAKHDKVRVVHQKNKGLGGARNTSVQNVHSPYFCFMDADDTVKENYISTLVQALDEHKDIYLFDIERIARDGKKTIVTPTADVNSHPLWGCVYSTDYFKGKKFEFMEKYVYEDNAISWFIFNGTNNKAIIHKPVYSYLFHPNSLSNDRSFKNIQGRIESSREFLKNAKKYGLDADDTVVKEKISDWYKRAISGCFYKEGDYKSTRYTIKEFQNIYPGIEELLDKKTKLIVKMIHKLGYLGYLFVLLTKISKKFK